MYSPKQTSAINTQGYCLKATLYKTTLW